MNSLNTPVQQVSVVFHVIDRIKDALLSKELRPGEFLPSETELAKNLGVGKTSIREAIKMLQALGIVEVKRGQGTVIRPTPGEEFINSMIFQFIVQDGEPDDIINLRIMFELAYTLMAMKQATEEDMENIRGIHHRFESDIQQGIQSVEDDLGFHRAILESTHNPFVIWIGEAILQLFKATMSKAMTMNPTRTLQNHQGIVEAFCERDEEKLREALLHSFEQWRYPGEHERKSRKEVKH